MQVLCQKLNYDLMVQGGYAEKVVKRKVPFSGWQMYPAILIPGKISGIFLRGEKFSTGIAV